MFRYNSDFPLSIAVWLAAEQEYDLVPAENLISATGLLRPLKAIVLSSRIPTDGDVELESLLPSKMGTAIHNGVETAWNGDIKKIFLALGYPEHVAQNVQVNPETPGPGLNVYTEQRTEKECNGYVISGKFDLVIEGELHDVKSTKTYTYIADSNARQYILQGSIYRWLNPNIITTDHICIDYVFTDWTAIKAKADPTYPPSRALSKKYQLLSLEQTENYIQERIAAINSLKDASQADMPLCTMGELWQEMPKFAYYKNPAKLGRATRLFDLLDQAVLYQASQGGVGTIMRRDAEVKRCHYCEARPICLQAERLQQQGLLKD